MSEISGSTLTVAKNSQWQRVSVAVVDRWQISCWRKNAETQSTANNEIANSDETPGVESPKYPKVLVYAYVRDGSVREFAFNVMKRRVPRHQ